LAAADMGKSWPGRPNGIRLASERPQPFASRGKARRITKKFLFVGCNSFLAGRLRALSEIEEQLCFVPHQYFNTVAASDHGVFDCILNFAIGPGYRSGRYSKKRDFDHKIAERLRATKTRYVMSSSRAVYSSEIAKGAKESGPATSKGTQYGRNKLETERRLGETLGNRLTVLRMANIIGNEYRSGRSTFMSQALDRLKSKNEIRLDISPQVRRDFLADSHFVKVLDAVLQEPRGGALNVGSGMAVRVGDIADWLIEGYGAGKVVVSDHRIHDEFVLDVTRLKSAYGIDYAPGEIADHCREIGRQLRRS
jgi:dTDP-4-dehydrorhamnose reductase/UDP-glucose 4-epimerase